MYIVVYFDLNLGNVLFFLLLYKTTLHVRDKEENNLAAIFLNNCVTLFVIVVCARMSS